MFRNEPQLFEVSDIRVHSKKIIKKLKELFFLYLGLKVKRDKYINSKLLLYHNFYKLITIGYSLTLEDFILFLFIYYYE